MNAPNSIASAHEPRTAEVARDTAETQITVSVNLDGHGQSELSTGIGFSTTCSNRSRATA